MVDYCGVHLMVKTVMHQIKLATVSQTEACTGSSNKGVLRATVKTWWRAKRENISAQYFLLVSAQLLRLHNDEKQTKKAIPFL